MIVFHSGLKMKKIVQKIMCVQVVAQLPQRLKLNVLLDFFFQKKPLILVFEAKSVAYFLNCNFFRILAPLCIFFKVVGNVICDSCIFGILISYYCTKVNHHVV